MARRGSGLSSLSVSDLQRELSRRQRRVGGLIRKRDRWAAKVAKLDAEIAALGGGMGAGVRRRGGGRARNSKNLVQALADLLKGKTMRVNEMTGAVQEAGYVTNSPNFRTIVNQTLTKHTKLFKRVGRGQYTAA